MNHELQAADSEAQRLRANLTQPHRTTTSVKAEGFSFPPNSIFMLNLHFIMSDPMHEYDALVPFGFDIVNSIE